MRKVFMLPTPTTANVDTSNSINQIVLKLQEHLPKYGWEVTENEEAADLVALHAGQVLASRSADVAHCHGLYPTLEDSSHKWQFAANKTVFQNILAAKRTTVPSQWVHTLLARELEIDAEIIPWALDISDWPPQEVHEGYTLWNKTRVDNVCRPEPVQELSEKIPAHFITTFYEGPERENVTVIGRKTYDEMKGIVRNSSVYLATTKETFGIGILEAMASGVPILGFNWGAVPDYVEHGVHGYLVEPGDYQGLENGWHYCMKFRDVLGQNARMRAQEYTWDRTASEFARVYDEVYREKISQSSIKVSVVIPHFNYTKYVSKAIASALQQKTDFEFEVILVDDQSNEPGLDAIVQTFSAEYDNFSYHIMEKNSWVAATRNYGISQAKGEYILCLDSDDHLGQEDALQQLAVQLDLRPEAGIVYGGLAIFYNDEDGQLIRSNWPGPTDHLKQPQGYNQIPTCCMFRKSVWERAKGYKSYLYPAGEDAELWTHMMRLGYEAAQITLTPLFHHRMHNESMTASIRAGLADEPNWSLFYPYGQNNFYPGPWPDAPKGSFPVGTYDRPVVSVIIPVGPGHEDIVYRALDSVRGQTYINWEVVLVNDTGHDLDVYPWVRIINPKGRVNSAAKARNIGIKEARGDFITFLDADDFYHPYFIDRMLQRAASNYVYAYCDWVGLHADGIKYGQCHDWSFENVFTKEILHTINIMIRREWLIAVEGFDENFSSWEDVDLFMKLATAGFCGSHIEEGLIYYDYRTGTLREQGNAIQAELKAAIYSKHSEMIDGGWKMGCCGSPPKQASASVATLEAQAAAKNNDDMIRVRYLGAVSAVTVNINGQFYGYRKRGDVFYVYKKDYESYKNWLEPAPEFTETIRETPEPPPPEVRL